MSDEWEQYYFGSITARDGSEDDDLDDITTVNEWNAESDPWKLDPNAIGEVGDLTVSQPDGLYWHKIRTEGVYANPVVIVGPAEQGGWSTPLITRVRNVGSASFEFQLDRFEYDQGDWENGNIKVSWLVMEAGRTVLGNGLAIEAGNGPVDADGASMAFSTPFATTPIVLAESVTYNGTYGAETRVQNVTPSGFKVILQNQESLEPHAKTETVSWVAIEPGFLQDEFGRRQAGTFTGINNQWKTREFPERVWAVPVFLATVQTFNGADPAVLRYRNLTDQKVDLKLFEDQSEDPETWHGNETVGWFAPKRRGIFHILPTTGDQDADGLPDAWEGPNGLAAGSGDIDGYYGDKDGDGLLNWEEYRAGTRADLADTDGDGIGDYEEINFFESDALAMDVDEFQFASSVAGADFVSSWGEWGTSGTDGFADSPRGWVEYPVTVTEDGLYALDLEVSPRAAGDLSKQYEFAFWVDGSFVARESVKIEPADTGTLRVLSPWMDAGTHTVRVFWENSYVKRRITIHGLDVFSAEGVDSDDNGTPDWVDIRLARQNCISTGDSSMVLESPTSPICLEGQTKYLEVVENNADLVLQRGPNDSWFSDVDLLPDADLEVSMSFENGAATDSRILRWTITNVMTMDHVQLRQGDSLLLAAWLGNKPNPSHMADMIIEGQEFENVSAVGPLEYRFDNPGTVEINLIYRRGEADGNDNGSPHTVVVDVVPRVDPESPICVIGHERPWEVPGLHPDAIVQIDDRVAVYDGQELEGGGFSYTIAVDQPEPRTAVVRLGPVGPILGSTEIRTAGIASGIGTGVFVTEYLPDGSMVLEMPLLLTGVWDDISVVTDIFRAGVVFPDGSTSMTISADQFDEFGFYVLKFIVPDPDSTNCHRFSVWQDGVRIAYFN